MIVLKFLLAILAAIGAYNTFIAYCAAIEVLEKKISERWLNIYIVFSILGIVAMILQCRIAIKQ